MNNYVIFDLETTGLNSKAAEIIEIAALKIKDENVIDEFSTLIKPRNPIPAATSEFNGITNDMVSDAPKISDVLPLFSNFIKDSILAGYNIASFDLPILRRIYHDELNIELHNYYVDILQIARKQLPDLPTHGLSTIASFLGVSPEGAHRALRDCYITLACYKKILELGACDLMQPKPQSTDKSNKSHCVLYSDQTKALQTLQGFLLGVIADDTLMESEVLALKKWLDSNYYLAGQYPFDRVFSVIQNALSDGILEQDELDEMLTLFKKFTSPIEEYSCTDEIPELSGKNICLTGDFNCGARKELEEILCNCGCKCQTAVSGKTDYVIVGALGSPDWAHGTYGGKVKRALELQEKGKNVQILKEEVFVEIMHAQGVSL